MKKNHLKIQSSLIVKFSADVQAKNFYLQVKFINCYLREIINFTKKNDIRDWGQSSCYLVGLNTGPSLGCASREGSGETMQAHLSLHYYYIQAIS